MASGSSCHAGVQFRFINMNLVEAKNRSPHLRGEGGTRDFSANKNGDGNAKENSHHARCSANCCIDRASGGCHRTPPHASEGPRGGLEDIAKQQCLCRTRRYCSAFVLVKRSRGRDDVGARWSLTCDVSKNPRNLGSVARPQFRLLKAADEKH